MKLVQITDLNYCFIDTNMQSYDSHLQMCVIYNIYIGKVKPFTGTEALYSS